MHSLKAASSPSMGAPVAQMQGLRIMIGWDAGALLLPQPAADKWWLLEPPQAFPTPLMSLEDPAWAHPRQSSSLGVYMGHTSLALPHIT